jgi:hypothetical protein
MVQVPVAAEAHRRVLADDRIRLESPNLAHDVAPQLDRIAQRAVLVRQKHDVPRAQGMSRVQLLGTPDLSELVRADVGIGRAFVAAGTQHVVDLFARCCPLGNGAAAAELGIVGVSHHHQYRVPLGHGRERAVKHHDGHSVNKNGRPLRVARLRGEIMASRPEAAYAAAEVTPK